ncbi:Hypothetical_protein [Hexamita inflata]|uniref:Hypothetical_protein n=1 Tax=Hexamita inflata TaxID=28002 RepID=A0AA86RVK3_9EUKA|nr:Hypothetical protein HINF_LOCUS66502 [Hexamita inflata]
MSIKEIYNEKIRSNSLQSVDLSKLLPQILPQINSRDSKESKYNIAKFDHEESDSFQHVPDILQLRSRIIATKQCVDEEVERIESLLFTGKVLEKNCDKLLRNSQLQFNRLSKTASFEQ